MWRGAETPQMPSLLWFRGPNSIIVAYGWLSRLWSLFGYPKYSVPYYHKDPKRDHNFDNHPYMMQGCHTPLPPPPCYPPLPVMWVVVLFGLVAFPVWSCFASSPPPCGVGPVVFLVGPARGQCVLQRYGMVAAAFL